MEEGGKSKELGIGCECSVGETRGRHTEELAGLERDDGLGERCWIGWLLGESTGTWIMMRFDHERGCQWQPRTGWEIWKEL